MPQSASDILRAALKQGNPNLSEKELNTTLGSMTPTPVKVETPPTPAQPKPSEPKPRSYYTPSLPFAKVSVKPTEPSSTAISKPVISNAYGKVGEKNDKVVEFRKLQAEATQKRDDLNKYKTAIEGYLKTKKFDGKPLTKDQTKEFNERLSDIDKFNKAYELDFGAINIKGVELDRAKQFRQPSLDDLKTRKTIDLSEENLKKIKRDSEEYKYGELLAIKLQDRERYARAFFGDSYANYQKKINQEIQKQNRYSVYNYNNPLVNPVSRTIQNIGSFFAEGLDRLSGDYAYSYYDAIKNTEQEIKDAQKQYDEYLKLTSNKKVFDKKAGEVAGISKEDYLAKLDKLEEQLYGTEKEGGTLYNKLDILKREGNLSYQSRAWLNAFSNISKVTEQLDSKIVKKKADEIVKSKQVIDSTASSLQSLNVPNKFYYVDPSGKEHFIDQSDKDKLSQQIFDKALTTITSKTDPSKFTLSAELRAYAAKFPNSPYIKNIKALGKERGIIQETLADAISSIFQFVTGTPQIDYSGILADNPLNVYMASKNKKDITNPLLRDINVNDWIKDFLYTSGFEGDKRTINAQAEERDEKIDLLVGGIIPGLRKQIELTTDPTLKKQYQDQLTAKVAELKRLEQDNAKEKERDAVLLKSLENRLSTQGKLSKEFIAKKESQDPDSFESVLAGSAQTTRDLLQFMAVGAAAAAAGRITGGAVSAFVPSLATSMTAASEAFVVLANRHLESKMEVNDAVSSNYDRYLNQMLAENGVSQKNIELMTKAEKELALPQEVLIELRNRARLGKDELYWKNMALAIPDLLQLRMLKSAFLKPAGTVGQEASNQIASDIIRTFGGVTVNLSAAGKSIVQAYGTGYLGEKFEEGFQNLGQRTQQQRSEKYDAPSFLSSFRTLVTDAYNTATSIRALPSISMTTLGGLYSDDKEFQYAAELGGFSGGVMGGMSAVSNISKDVYGFTFANRALKELGIFDTGFVSDIIAGEALRRSFEKGNSEYILKLLQNKKKILLANDADGKKFSPNNSKESLQNIDDPLLQQLRTIAADRAARGDSSLLEHIEFLEKEAQERKLYSARTAEETYDAFVNRYLLARDIYNSSKKNISKYRGNLLSFVGDEESRKDLSAEQRANMERDSKGLLGAYNRFNSVLAENAFAYARGKEDLAYFKSLRDKLVDSELEQLSSVHPNLNKNTLSLLYQLNAIPEMDLEDPMLQMIIAQDPSYKERFEKVKTYYDKLRTDLTKQLEDEINNNEKSKEFLKDLINYNYKNEFSINLSKLKELKGIDPTKSFLNEVVGQAFVLSNLNNTSFEFAGNQIEKLGKIKSRRQLVNWYNDHLSEAEKRLMKIRNQQLKDLISKEQNGEELTEEEEDLKNKLTQSTGLPDSATNEEIISEIEDQPTEEEELDEEGTPLVVTLTNSHLFNTFPENPINIKVKLEKYKLAKNIKGLRKLIDNDIEFDLVEVNNKDGYFVVSYGNQLYTIPITGGPLDATNIFTPNLNNEENPGTQLELDIFEYTDPQEPIVELVDINEAEADQYGDLTEEELQQSLDNIEQALYETSSQLEIIDDLLDDEEVLNPYRIVADNMQKMSTKSVRKAVGKRWNVGKEGLLAYVSNNVKLSLDGLADKIWSQYFRDSNYDSMDIRDMIIELLQIGKKKFLETYTTVSNKSILKQKIKDLERERNVILNYLNKIKQQPVEDQQETPTPQEKKNLKPGAKGILIWVSPGFGKTIAASLLNDLIDADALMEEALLEVVPDGSATRQSLLKNGKHYSKQAEVQALFISKIEQALAEGKTVVTANWMVAAAAKKGRLKIDVVVQATDAQDIVNRTKDRGDSALDMDASQKQIQRANELPVSRRFTLMPGQTLYDVLVEGSEQTVSEILPQPPVTITEMVTETPVVEEPIGKEVNDPRMQVRVYEFTSMTVDQNAGDSQQRVRNKRAFVNNPQRNQTHNLTITVPSQATTEELKKLGMIPGMPVIPYTFLQNGLINPSKLNKQQLQALREGKPFLVKINPNITTRISITNKSRNEIMNLQSPDTYYIVIPNKDFKPEVAIVDGKETITNLNLLSVKLFDPNEYSETQLAKILKFNTNNTQATPGEIRQFVESYNINKIIFNNLSGIIKPGSPINISLEELAKYGISVDITSGMIKFTPQLFDISSFTENENFASVFEGVGPVVVRMTSNGVIEFLNPNLTREQQNQIRSTNLGNDGGYKLIIKHPVTNKLMFIDIKVDSVSLDRSTQGTLIKQAILKLTNAVSTAFDENITDIKFYNDQMKLFGLKDAELSIINRNPNASGLFFNLKIMVSNGEVVLNQEGKPTFILEVKKNNKIVAKVPIDEILAQDSIDDIMKVISEKIVGTSTESEAAKKALSDTTGISINQKNKDINAILNTGKTNVSPSDPFTESQVALNLAENIISELSPEEIEEIIVSELEDTPELPDSNNTNGSVALKLFDTFYENNLIDVDTILDENEVSLEKIRELIESQEKVFRTILEFEVFVKENAC